MNRDNIFRLALVTHSNAPKTIKKYISLLSKLIVIEYKLSRFTTNKISNQIRLKYDLDFSKNEIKEALKYDNDFVFYENEGQYQLKPEGAQHLKDIEKDQQTIEYFINEFLKEYYELSVEEAIKMKEKVNQYIYTVFNSGKKALSSLLSGVNNITETLTDFYASEKDKKIINDFLAWNNPQKNECIYTLVSYCIDYGMLTCKKDTEVCKSIFEGINFFLDTNIILRLIGMNNIERQEVTQHFIDKCNEVNIKLCYTNFTLAEIEYVINKAVHYIKEISHGDEPIPIEDLDKLGEYNNKDFYELYFNWYIDGNNRYDDYESFIEFLKDNAEKCLFGFEKIDISNAEYTDDSKEFIKFTNSLKEYKNKRNPDRFCSLESAKTDVNNFMYVKNMAVSKDESISNKNFIITADHRFYDWTHIIIPGVPVSFLPSEWLSIILKFSSRSESDYNTFCMFMNLRLYKDDKTKLKNMQIIQSINEHTTDVEIKRKAIRYIGEINIKNSNDIRNEEGVVDRVFDKILEEHENNLVDEHKKIVSIINNKSHHEIESVRKDTEKDTIHKDAEITVNENNRIWNTLNEHTWIPETISGIISFVVLFFIAFTKKIADYINSLCNNSSVLNGKNFEVAIAVSAIITLIIMLIIYAVIKYKSSENRRKKLINRTVKLLMDKRQGL